MIDALIGGKLYEKAMVHKSKVGKEFATCKVVVGVADGESVFVSVISFDENAVRQILSLDGGDSICLSGELSPKLWTAKNGETRPALDLVAHAVLTPYHVKRKRQAMQDGA